MGTTNDEEVGGRYEVGSQPEVTRWPADGVAAFQAVARVAVQIFYLACRSTSTRVRKKVVREKPALTIPGADAIRE